MFYNNRQSWITSCVIQTLDHRLQALNWRGGNRKVWCLKSEVQCLNCKRSPEPIFNHLKWGLILEATSPFHPHHCRHYRLPFYPDFYQRPLYSFEKHGSLLGNSRINRILSCHSISGPSLQMADSFERYPPLRTFQDLCILSFIPHGLTFQIRRTLLSLPLKQNQWNEYHRGNGLFDCLEGLRFLHLSNDISICFDWVPKLF